MPRIFEFKNGEQRLKHTMSNRQLSTTIGRQNKNMQTSTSTKKAGLARMFVDNAVTKAEKQLTTSTGWHWTKLQYASAFDVSLKMQQKSCNAAGKKTEKKRFLHRNAPRQMRRSRVDLTT